uniref:Uncharacterized protein n=1 Tax=Trichuris muris TaxID=70415 RepID=A0A5S6QUE0_TRIMR
MKREEEAEEKEEGNSIDIRFVLLSNVCRMHNDARSPVLRAAELRKEVLLLREDVKHRVAQLRHFAGAVTQLEREEYNEISNIIADQEIREENMKFFRESRSEASDLLVQLKEAMATSISNIEDRRCVGRSAS